MLNDVFNKFVQFLGDKYKVLIAYDANQQISLDGVIAININSIQYLHHGNTKDRKMIIAVNGQTLTDDDKDRKIINQMCEYAINRLQLADYSQIEYCVGHLINACSIISDGQSNNFSIDIELFISED